MFSNKFLYATLAFFWAASFLSVEGQVKLEYKTDIPVDMITSQSFIIDQVIPGFDFNARGKQSITSTLKIATNDPNNSKKISKPPFNLELMLKAIEVDISSNGSELVFDTQKPQGSLVARQLSKWVDKTLSLTVDENLNLIRNSDELGFLVKRFPVIKELDPYTLLEGLLLPIFALADQELSKGTTINKNNFRSVLGMSFSTLNYEITEITDRQVVATFHGSMEPYLLALNEIPGSSESGLGLVHVNISGDVQGKASWDITNALVCQISGDYNYRCNLKIGSIEWPLSLKIKSSLQTTPSSIMVTNPKEVTAPL